jgi:phage-related minor tail protein
MATRSLNVTITGDSKPLGVAAKQADRHMDGVEKSAGRMGKAVKSGFAVAAVGTGALVVGLKKSVDAAVDAEKSQAKLKAQLKASGASYRAHAKEIDAVIQKHSRLAGVDDEDLQDAFTGIVRATGSVGPR